MDLSKLHRKLIEVARANSPREDVPYAFEKRIMARLTAPPSLDSWTAWSRALWRATVPCAALVVVLGALAYWTQDSSPFDNSGDDFETTVLADINHIGESW